MSAVEPYVQRLIDPFIATHFETLPAILVTGPRAAGKTTTATRHAKTRLRLDIPAQAAALESDPDAVLRGLEEPVLLDEWQNVPSVMGAVKRTIDGAFRGRRFLLTGSVRDRLPLGTWPGTGRVITAEMWGLNIRERLGRVTSPSPIDRLAAGATLERVATDPPDLRGYVDLALESGFPLPALTLSVEQRRIWLEAYVTQIVDRDAIDIGWGRDPARFRRYVEAYSANSARTVSESTLVRAAGIARPTAMAYNRLLHDLLFVREHAGWRSNRMKRLTEVPRRYVADPALAATVLGVDADGVLRDGDLLGGILETFVVAQLRPETVIAERRARLFHLREQQGRREVDVVIELAGGRMIGIEVKASAGPTASDARHLAWMRDELGESFITGVVLHTGPRQYALGDRLVALPIAWLWAP